LGKEFPELLCHFPVVVPNHVRVAHGCAWVGMPQTILPHLHRRVQVIEQTCVPMSERMGCSIQAELLQDGFQLPLDEVVGVQATTFCAQEKWLVGIPSLDVEPQAFGKLRRKSEESLLAVLRPLQLAFPPAALHGDCLFVQADISDVQAADFSAPDARLRYQPEDGLVWLVRGIDDLFDLCHREARLLFAIQVQMKRLQIDSSARRTSSVTRQLNHTPEMI
jgi:hypothetical protein